MILLVYFDVLDFPGFQVGQNDFRILKRFISFMNGEFTPYKHLILPLFGLLSPIIIRYVVNFSYSLPEIYQLRTVLEYLDRFSFTDIATSIYLSRPKYFQVLNLPPWRKTSMMAPTSLKTSCTSPPKMWAYNAHPNGIHSA